MIMTTDHEKSLKQGVTSYVIIVMHQGTQNLNVKKLKREQKQKQKDS